MQTDRIEIDPMICAGQPVIRGTRIPVAVLVAQLAEGESWDSLLHNYPELTPADLRAALKYASAIIEQSELVENSA